MLFAYKCTSKFGTRKLTDFLVRNCYTDAEYLTIYLTTDWHELRELLGKLHRSSYWKLCFHQKDDLYLLPYEGLTKKGANKHVMKQYGWTVEHYFRKHLGVELKHPEWPCLIYYNPDFTPVYVPFELVYLAPT